MHAFGGSWTRTKLAVLKKYLEAYMTLMSGNPRARHFRKIYVDAFAGSGEVYLRSARLSGSSEESSEDDTVWPIEGSAKIALDLSTPFDEYLFVEKRRRNIELLNELRQQHTLRDRIRIEHAESNAFVKEWIRTVDWRKCRALVFLDPFALQVDFETIAALGSTQAVDLWLLFPLSAVNRVLVRRGKPMEKWKQRLTRFFGTAEWEQAFYQEGQQPDLFTGSVQDEKVVKPEGVTRYFNERLGKHFAMVVEEPMTLKNSSGANIFVLMFASANPKGAPTAVKIARDIIQRELRDSNMRSK